MMVTSVSVVRYSGFSVNADNIICDVAPELRKKEKKNSEILY